MLHRLLDIGLEFDIDPVTNFKGLFLSVLVSLMLHSILCALQILLDVLKHGLPLFQPLLQVRDYTCIIYCDFKMPGLVTIGSLEWSEAMSRMKCGVVSELS